MLSISAACDYLRENCPYDFAMAQLQTLSNVLAVQASNMTKGIYPLPASLLVNTLFDMLERDHCLPTDEFWVNEVDRTCQAQMPSCLWEATQSNLFQFAVLAAPLLITAAPLIVQTVSDCMQRCRNRARQ